MIWSQPTHFQRCARLLALGADAYCTITEEEWCCVWAAPRSLASSSASSSSAVSFEGCIYWPITSHPAWQDSPKTKTNSSLQHLFFRILKIAPDGSFTAQQWMQPWNRDNAFFFLSLILPWYFTAVGILSIAYCLLLEWEPVEVVDKVGTVSCRWNLLGSVGECLG